MSSRRYGYTAAPAVEQPFAVGPRSLGRQSASSVYVEGPEGAAGCSGASSLRVKGHGVECNRGVFTTSDGVIDAKLRAAERRLLRVKTLTKSSRDPGELICLLSL